MSYDRPHLPPRLLLLARLWRRPSRERVRGGAVVAQVRLAIPTEHDEQVALFREMHLRGCTDPRWRQAFAIPNGGLRSKKTAARLKAEGVKAGVPDIFLPVSVGIWSGLFIEMKRTKGGRLTDEQREFIDRLDPHFIVVVAHGAQEAIEKIHDYLSKGWITA